MSKPDIYLHVTEKGADRGLIVGESGTGKSTLAKRLLDGFKTEYLPAGRMLILDTKPRWRATRVLNGDPITKRYKRMVPGDEIDSMILDRLSDWPLLWDRDVNPSRTVIVQPPANHDYDEDREIARQVMVARKFFNTLNPKEPSLMYIDEGKDFFGPNGAARHGTIIQRGYRAGRERGLSTLMGVQRPSCITIESMSESNVKYVFALGTEDDFKTLTKKGLPKGVRPVEEDYYFRLVRNRQTYPKLLTLKLQGDT